MVTPRVSSVPLSPGVRKAMIAGDGGVRTLLGLPGVLVPFPTSWYEEALSGVGFVEIAIVHATCGFVTWMARKPHAPPSTVEDGMCAAPSHGC